MCPHGGALLDVQVELSAVLWMALQMGISVCEQQSTAQVEDA
jgi:hypothetical protein